METRADFEYFTQLAFNKPFMLKINVSSYKSISRNGLRHYLYECSYAGKSAVLSLPKRLHDLISNLDCETICVYSHTSDEVYNWTLHYEYFKDVVYDFVPEEAYNKFYLLT